MSRTLPGIGLTGFWPLGFDGWNSAMDVNLRLCSALMQARALNLVSADPGSPSDGDIYLFSNTHPTHPGVVAVRDAGAWVYVTPQTGWKFYDVGGAVDRRFDGSTWATLTTSGALLAANNLSDVASASTARTNLGLGSAATAALDTDGTLAANSDTSIASQKAVRTYIAAKITGMWDLRGSTDCSANPNYPAASKGDAYVVTVAGKIGGASGTTVAIGDIYVATADNAGGTQAAVGASWDTIVHASVAAGGGLLAANNLSDVASASTSRANLGLGSIATEAEATAAQYQAATAAKALAADKVWSAAAYVALTDAATIALDFSAMINASVTLGGNRTLGAPTNMKEGQTGLIAITQDGTGTRTLAYNAAWKFAGGTAPTLSTAAAARDLLFYQVLPGATAVYGTLVKAV